MLAVNMSRAIAWLMLALIVGCGSHNKPTPTGSPLFLTMPALDGGDIELSAYRGRVVVLHMFTTWEPLTHLDIDQLTLIEKNYSGRAIVIGVAFDANANRVVGAWRRQAKADYLIGIATDAMRSGHSPLGKIGQVPTTVVLDVSGRVAVRIDRSLAPDELERIVERLAPTAAN